MMSNPAGVKTHAFHLGSCAPIVLSTDSIVQEKFGPPLRRIYIDRLHRSRTDQNPVIALFGNDKRSLFDPEATPELRRQNYCATLADSAR